MKRNSQNILLLCTSFILLFLLSSCGGGGDSEAETAYQNRVQEIETISSSRTGGTYPIHVYLPEGYESSDKNYPVLYTTDGDYFFSKYARQFFLRQIQAIVVAVGNGGTRATDYVLPGAKAYYQFLATELIPMIDAQYRTDEQERTISGHSYGGLLVGSVLLMEDPVTPLFNNYIAMDGSFFENSSQLYELEDQRFSLSNEMPGKVVLTSATGIGNHTHVTEFNNRLSKRGYSGLTIYRHSYDMNHNEVITPSINVAIEKIFQQLVEEE